MATVPRSTKVKIPTLSHRTREGRGTRFDFVVGERPQGFSGDQVSAMRDRDGRGGESLLGDGFLQDGEGLGEFLVLMLEGFEQRG